MPRPATTDDFADPQIAALLNFCSLALVANLPTSNPNTPVLRTAYGWPVNRARISAGEFPVLLIYRKRSQSYAHTVGHDEHRGTFAFEYTMGPTPNDRIGKAWNLLPLIWQELVRLVKAGHDPSVSSDAAILNAAGFVDIDEDACIVDYEQPKPDVDVWPGFAGTMVLTHRTEIDISGLQALLSLDAQYRLVNSGSADQLLDAEQPLVEQIINT